jgi:hypothetical protein
MLGGMDVEDAVAAVQRAQHGLITWDQALAAGVSPSGIRTRLARGDWVTVRRGVYRLAGVRPSFEHVVMAACLAVGDACWASGRTAARLWGLDVPAPVTVEVLTPPGVRVRLGGVTQHRSSELFTADVTRHRLVPVTSVARTLVDAATQLPGRRLGEAVDDALRRGLLDLDELAACVDRLDRGGRRLIVPLRRVLADRLLGYDPGGSRRELDVLGVLRRGGLPAPVQQFEVVVGGRRRVLDYAYPDERVGLEFDGFAEHGLLRSTFDDDRVRGNDLAVAGWLVLHFTSKSAPGHVVERTAEALSLRRRRPA